MCFSLVKIIVLSVCEYRRLLVLLLYFKSLILHDFILKIRLLCVTALVAVGLAVPPPPGESGRHAQLFVIIIVFARRLPTDFFASLSSDAVCKLSDWGEWSACKQAKRCDQPDVGPSFPVDQAVWDEGRIKMARLMELKERNNRKRQECIANGECPALYLPDSEGYGPCIDGKCDFSLCWHSGTFRFRKVGRCIYRTRLRERNSQGPWVKQAKLLIQKLTLLQIIVSF